jgi:predicted Rossmann fold flavoprotein
MCACELARAGLRTVLFDRNTAAGKKLLISGQGRCNLTQDTDADGIAAAFFEKARFLKHAAYAFTPEDTREFFGNSGVPLETRDDGKVFPRSGVSADVRDALVSACRKAGVAFHLGERVREISEADPFEVRTDKDTYAVRAVVFACGGASYPATGSDGSAYALAKSLGHTIVAPRSALVGVRIADPLFSESAGVAFGDIGLSCGAGKDLHRTRGAAVCTHLGISGPAVLRLSRYLSKGDVLTVDFAPTLGREACLAALYDAATSARSRMIKTQVADWVPQRLALRLVAAAGLVGDEKFSQCTKAALAAIADAVCAYRCSVAAVGGLHEAMATRGGVSTDEIDAKTMESRVRKGIFFAGEYIDIDGDTGGYNIQMAFATGVLAARAIAQRICA